MIQFVLFLILCFGAYLRFSRYPPIWTVDTARDLLMGLHISRFHEIPAVGHWALGMSIPYPPYYYYFLGLLSYISADLFFIFSVFVFIQLAGIIALYKIGALLYGKKTGLLAGLLYAISAITVISGAMIETVFLNIPVFLFSALSIIIFYRRSKIRFAYLSIFLILLSSAIHASSVPFLFLFVFLALVKLTGKSLARIFTFLLLVSSMILVFYSPVIRYYPFPEFLSLLSPGNPPFSPIGFFPAFFQNWEKLLRLLFFSRPLPIIYFIFYFFILLFLLLYNSPKRIKALLFPLGCITYFLLSAAVFPEEIHLHYLTVLIPFVFLTVSFLLTENFKSRYLFPGVITLSLSAVLLLIFLNGLTGPVPWVVGNYRVYEKLADTIFTGTRKIKKLSRFDRGDFYRVLVIAPEDDYKNSFLLWYFLEKKYRQKLVKIADTRKDFIPVGETELDFLVCDLSSVPDFDPECLQEYSRVYPGNNYQRSMETNDSNYTTHVFTKAP